MINTIEMMQKFLFILACILASIIAQDNSSNEPLLKPHAAIINGYDVPDGGRPFQTSLQTANKHFCGGSVISRHYVLSAAHCTRGKKPADISIVAGTIDLRKPYKTYQVSKIISHPLYQPATFRNDISLLRTSTPIQFNRKIQPIRLTKPFEPVPPGTRAIVSGWGRTLEPSKLPNILQEVAVSVYNLTYCRTAVRKQSYDVFNSNICAGNSDVIRAGECNGDSGGPLTTHGKQIGIVSWSIKDPGCASLKYPGVFTRVSFYDNWILNHTQNLS